MAIDEPIEFQSVDALGTGAVGDVGQRAFYIQARSDDAQLTVLVEKEQVALLSTEAVAFLDRIADEFPEDPLTLPLSVAELHEPTVPLFRARLIGLGFDPERELVLIELRERSSEEQPVGGPGGESGRGDEGVGFPTGVGGPGGEGDDSDEDHESDEDEEDGYIARIYATRPQVRAMAARGAQTVAAGRPPCPLCNQPMDPAGHRCPRWN